jgi:probable HAF family extracellular repeat protein
VRRCILLLISLLWLSCESDSPAAPRKNRNPIARIAGACDTLEGAWILFDASGSVDADGDSISAVWNFGDGLTGTGPVSSHFYRDDGVYTVTLIVADPSAAKDTARVSVHIANAPPVITALFTPTTVEPGAAATIYFFYSDPGLADSLHATMDFGDQTSALVTRGFVTHEYASAGLYTVTVTVRDDDGATTQRTGATPIRVGLNQPPTARISGVATVREGSAAMFSARGSTDPDGDTLRYTWLAGDGRVFDQPYYGSIEQGWSYPDNGTFGVSVIVTDARGAADTASTMLTVVNVPPVVSIDPPSQQAIGVPAPLGVTFSDSGSNDTQVLTIHWGDGSSDSLSLARQIPFDSLIHVYTAAGTYSVKAILRDKDGGVGTTEASASVFDPTRRQTISNYEAIDIGTLGGNNAWPNDVNDFGQIVGSSLTASGARHAFLWENGVMRDLGTMGHVASEAQRINNAGVISGTVWSERVDDCGYGTSAAVWRQGTGAILEGHGVNGPISAVTTNEAGDFVWRVCGHEDPYAWVSRDNTWRMLGSLTPSSTHAAAQAINERGQVVGSAAAVYTGESPWPRWHAFIWENGNMRDLGVFSPRPCRDHPDKECGSSTALSINEAGQIAGFSTASDGSSHAVVWENEKARDLWTIPAESYYDTAVINDVGQVAGSAGGQAFFWSNGEVRILGSLGGGGTQVVDMNEAGMIAGTSMTVGGERHAFVWTEARGMVDLGTGPNGFKAAWVVGISFRGDVVGYTQQCSPTSNCSWPHFPRAILWRRVTP